MINLSVNLNKIALLRNSREGENPDILDYAETSIESGAKGITLHPRPDQRHIRTEDVRRISALITSNHKDTELNIEGNPFTRPNDSGFKGFDEIITETVPTQVTLVPDDNNQLTSDHGWNLNQNGPALAPKIRQYQKLGCRVSLFLDPDMEQINKAKDIGADRIELYTGPFAQIFSERGPEHPLTKNSFLKFNEASEFASKLGLAINAGHDLNLQNLKLFSSLSHLAEVSIGHAIVTDSLKFGFVNTIKDYLNALKTL